MAEAQRCRQEGLRGKLGSRERGMQSELWGPV